MTSSLAKRPRLDVGGNGVAKSSNLIIRKPTDYRQRQTPDVSQPKTVTTFSYDENRSLLLRSSNRHNDALRWFRFPKVPSDLNYGRDQCVWREEKPEGLDSLLYSLLELPNHSIQDDQMISKTTLITWRGIMTKILTSVYSDDAWTLDVMILNGTLYMQEYISEEDIEAKKNVTNVHKTFMYNGYAFESYCTSAQHPQRPDLAQNDVDPATGWSGNVNTNVQWCNVIRTSLGNFRSILGGEVDCLFAAEDENGEPKPVDSNSTLDDLVMKSESVELKTCLRLRNERDYIRFERFKLLKFYIQSFLLGVSKIYVGFRDKGGNLVDVNEFKTLNIPRLVRQKEHGWDHNICLNSGYEILGFIYDTVKNHQDTKAHAQKFNEALEREQEYESQFQSQSQPPSCLSNWPVFRVKFTPSPRNDKSQLPSLSVTPVDDYNLKSDDRVGFLPNKWVKSVFDRYHRLKKAHEKRN